MMYIKSSSTKMPLCKGKICMKGTQTNVKEPFWLQIESHSPIINTTHPLQSKRSHLGQWLPDVLQLPVELYKSAPSGSHSYTFMLVMIALFVGEGAKCPNDSLRSLKSSFSFLCEAFFYPTQFKKFTLCMWFHIPHIIKGPETLYKSNRVF